MFSSNRKINTPNPLQPAFVPDVARIAIAEDGTVAYANDAFRAMAHIPVQRSEFPNIFSILHFETDINEASLIDAGLHRVTVGNSAPTYFHFDWLTMPGNKRYLVGAETKNSPPTPQQDADDAAALIDLSGEIMLTISESGALLQKNSAFLRITGYDADDLINMDFIDFFHDEDKPYIRNTIRSENEDDPDNLGVSDFQARILTKDHQTRLVEWRQHRRGDKTYFVGRDVTTIREQQNAMGRRERQLSQAESIGRMGHWNWTLGQDELEWSSEIYRIFGVDRKNFHPTMENILSLVQKSDRPRVEHSFQRAAIGQNSYEMEFRITRPDGEVRFLRCEGRCAQDTEGYVTALYGIMQDMTERILYERELKRTKNAAERAYAAKTQFLANMSHELRTPLNAIIGFSEMMHRQLLGPIGTEKYLEYIQGIRESGEHLLDLIIDILDMSKIEAGKYDLALEEVAVAKTLRLALHMMESRAEDAGVNVKIEKIPDDTLCIIADRRALLQVVLNILSNAVKFTPKGGSVSIDCTEKKDYISIKVSDTGIGIPANKLASITKPFEQVSSHYTREHEGTGLGLAITKELMEMHGGILHIDSTVNVGTTVTARFPRDGGEKKGKSSPPFHAM